MSSPFLSAVSFGRLAACERPPLARVCGPEAVSAVPLAAGALYEAVARPEPRLLAGLGGTKEPGRRPAEATERAQRKRQERARIGATILQPKLPGAVPPVMNSNMTTSATRAKALPKFCLTISQLMARLPRWGS